MSVAPSHGGAGPKRCGGMIGCRSKRGMQDIMFSSVLEDAGFLTCSLNSLTVYTFAQCLVLFHVEPHNDTRALYYLCTYRCCGPTLRTARRWPLLTLLAMMASFVQAHTYGTYSSVVLIVQDIPGTKGSYYAEFRQHSLHNSSNFMTLRSCTAVRM